MMELILVPFRGLSRDRSFERSFTGIGELNENKFGVRAMLTGSMRDMARFVPLKAERGIQSPVSPDRDIRSTVHYNLFSLLTLSSFRGQQDRNSITMTSSKVADVPSTEANTETTSPANPSLTEKNPPEMEDTVKDQEKELEYVTGLKLYLVLLSTTLVAFLVMLDQTVMAPAIPRISVQFKSLKDIGKCFFHLSLH